MREKMSEEREEKSVLVCRLRHNHSLVGENDAATKEEILYNFFYF